MCETLDGEPIVEVNCKECGEKDEASFGKSINTLMILRSLCFTCLYWYLRISEKDQPTSVRIKGRHYTICAENAPKPRGFGGNLMVIQFFDGHIIESHNLWSQGEIPERFRMQLPDNAKFR